MNRAKPSTMTREEAATALGQSIKEIDRLINRGDLRTTIERGLRGGRPSKRVYEEDVQIVLQHAKKTARDAPSPSFADRYTPEDASRVFAAFRSGKTVEDVVIDLKIHPTAAMAIKRAWDEVKGQVTLSRDELSRVEKLGLEGNYPLTSSDALMDVVETAAKEKLCTSCKERGATQCRTCAREGARSVSVRQPVNGAHHEGEPS